MGLLDGKSFIVHGAAQGIPQAVSVLATREGARVLAVDINGEGLEETAHLIEKEGGTPQTMLCDVTDREQVFAAVDRAAEVHGGIDVLVNGAMNIRVGPFEEQTPEDFLFVLDVNLFGPFHFMQACFPHLRESGAGRVISFASGSGTRGSPDHSTYAAAKEGLRGMSKAVARAWVGHGITVNCIMPHANTPGMVEVANQRGPDGFQNVVNAHPTGRLGDPYTDIAPVVLFLASDGAGYITGRSIFVDGGYSGFW